MDGDWITEDSLFREQKQLQFYDQLDSNPATFAEINEKLLI